MELTENELDRYSRQIMLDSIGYQGQLKLKNAKVCIVGAGGLGNPISSQLTAMGIGTLRIVDRDIIELSNLHRQTLFDEDDVGKVKVEVIAKKLQKLNKDCKIEPTPMSLIEQNAVEIIQGCDIVIDALDNMRGRTALNKACIKLNIPLITTSAIGVTGQVFTIIPKESACYSCVTSDSGGELLGTCGIEGVHPSVLSIVGGIAVTEAVKIITGKTPNLCNRILHIDLDNLYFTFTRTEKVKECIVCN